MLITPEIIHAIEQAAPVLPSGGGLSSETLYVLAHLLPSLGAVMGAWFAVRYELRSLRRVTQWSVGILIRLVEDHNRRHPEMPIPMGDIGEAFFGRTDGLRNL